MARYSYSSDESADELHPLAPSLLSRKKKEIVSKSMAVFETRLNTWLDNTTPSTLVRLQGKRARDETDTAAEDHAPLSPACGAGSPRVARTRQKRAKREVEVRKFACPFYKHCPDRYKGIKTCMGPGWDTLHRVKEHLYRNHKLPEHTCVRCYASFDGGDKLKQHQRAVPACEVKTSAPPDGFTEDQEKKLRVRARGNAGDQERWVEMYRILFPTASVPSPYYDTGETSPDDAGKRDKDREVEAYKEYLRRELPRRVKPLIEQEVERQIKSVERAVKVRAEQFCHQIHDNLVRTWVFSAQQSAARDLDGNPQAAPESPVATPSAIGECSGLDAIDHPLIRDVLSDTSFDLEALFATFPDSLACDISTDTGITNDSTYFSTGGPQESHSALDEYALQYNS